MTEQSRRRNADWQMRMEDALKAIAAIVEDTTTRPARRIHLVGHELRRLELFRSTVNHGDVTEASDANHRF